VATGATATRAPAKADVRGETAAETGARTDRDTPLTKAIVGWGGGAEKAEGMVKVKDVWMKEESVYVC